jgi:hypothetical protein
MEGSWNVLSLQNCLLREVSKNWRDFVVFAVVCFGGLLFCFFGGGVCLFIFWDRVLLCSSGWLWT